MAAEQRNRLTEFVKREFAPLVEGHGFSDPLVSSDGAITHVDYLSANIGVEIELDWREFQAFVLLVRLENAHLPEGYYVSNGRSCRKHLQNVLQDLGRGSRPVRRSWRRGVLTEDDLRASIVEQKNELLPHIDDLVGLGDALF